MRGLIAILAAALVVSGGCGGPRGPVEATSLLGRPLRRPDLDPATLHQRRQQLAEARATLARDPDSEAALIWVGRRLAYLNRYPDAIELYTEGLRWHPASYRILRHRGHRYITIRRLDLAVADLQRAAMLARDVPDEVEPDGLPNALGVPTGTTRTNIEYHLGLAHYLRGEYPAACEAYRRCLELAANDDMRVAARYWLYLALRRLELDDEAAAVLAPVTAGMTIIENHAYHELLMLFQGRLTAPQVLSSGSDPGPVGARIDDATRGYGVGAWHLLNGRAREAREIFEQVIAGPAWPAFGYIAAEAQLADRAAVVARP